MTPDRLRQFLYKPPQTGRAVSLLADQGLGSHSIVCTYTKEECEAAADPASGRDLAQEVLEEAIEHCDANGESTKFMLVWFNSDNRQIKSSPHTAHPSEGTKRAIDNGVTLGAEPMSANRIVGELLNALLAKDKTLNASIGVVLLAHEKAMAQQQKTIESQGKLIETLADQVKVSRRAPEAPARTQAEIDAEIHTQEMKSAALAKLVEQGPQLITMGVAAWLRHNGIRVPGMESEQ